MNYLETIKNIAKDKNKRTKNLVLIAILLVVLLIAANYIFTPKKVNDELNNAKRSNNTSSNGNIDSSVEENSQAVQASTTSLEGKLENVLSQISGISEVSVVISYSLGTKQNAIYNTKEQEKAGEKTTERSVAYNEEGSKKTAVIESIETPKADGAIIVAKGASTVDMRSKIANAISSLANIPVYKVQVFEKQG